MEGGAIGGCWVSTPFEARLGGFHPDQCLEPQDWGETPSEMDSAPST